MKRKIRMGMVGGVHRIAARLDGKIELVCGAFGIDPAYFSAAASGSILANRIWNL